MRQKKKILNSMQPPEEKKKKNAGVSDMIGKDRNKKKGNMMMVMTSRENKHMALSPCELGVLRRGSGNIICKVEDSSPW